MTTTIFRFFDRWRPRPPHPRLSPFHGPEGVRAGSGGVRLQLIARGLCHVRFVPHGDVPPADRAAHLRTQLLAWQPFDVAGYALVDGEHGTTVWAWDQAAFAARADAAGLPTQPPQVLPETLVRPAHGDGVALSRCTAGVEAQVWQAGQLVASRWWPQAPDVTAWRNFQRSAGVKPEQQQPELPALPEGEPPWLDAPWAWPQTPAGMAERARLRTHAAIAVVAALLVLPTLALLHTRWQLGQSIDALEQARTELQAQALPLTAARGEAMASLATLDAIRARVEHPQALTLLAHLGQHLPADGSALRSLEWNGRQLQLELSAPAATPRITYVQALEAGGWLRNVREDTQETGAGTVVLRADVEGLAPPASAPAASAASDPTSAGTR